MGRSPPLAFTWWATVASWPVASTVYFVLSVRGVDVEVRHLDRRPVDDEAGDASVALDNDILHHRDIEKFRAGIAGSGREACNRFDGGCDVVILLVFLVGDAECIENGPGFLLDNDAGEHHPAAPHAAADGELLFDDTGLDSCLGEVGRGSKSGGPCAHDRTVEVEVVHQNAILLFENCTADDHFIEFLCCHGCVYDPM